MMTTAICYACHKRINVYVPPGGEGMIFRKHRESRAQHGRPIGTKVCVNSHGPVDEKQDFVKRRPVR